MTDKQCGCQKQGLAILPVRYTVIPSQFEQKTPTWANLSSVTKVPLNTQYQYHIRTIRNGFLYVFLPNEIGKDKWQVYIIDDEGNLYKQNSPHNVKTYSELVEGGAFQCPNLKNNETHNKFITIANPAEQKEVYIAYSEIPLHEEILEKYEQDPQKRMQKISTEQWKGKQQQSLTSATTASKQTLEQILDLDPTFDQNKLPYDQSGTIVACYNIDSEEEQTKKKQKDIYLEQLSYNRKGINEKTGAGGFQSFGYDKLVLNSNTTRTPWSNQKGLSATLASTMTKYSAGYSPLIIAIEDPIGIALELNGYYNEIFAKNNQYRQERNQEFQALESYEYVLQVLSYKEFEGDFKYDHTEHPYFKRVMKDRKLPETEDLPIFSAFNQLSVLIQKELHNKPYSEKYKSGSGINDDFSAYHYKTDKYYEWERNYFLHGKNYSAYQISLSNTSIVRKKYPISGISDSNKNYIQYFESPAAIRNELNLNSYFKVQKYLKDPFENYQQNEELLKQEKINKINSIRNKYDKCLDTNSINTLNEQYEKLQKEIAQIAAERVLQLISWIKQSSFYQYMKDFDGNLWVEISNSDPNEKWLDNQQEIDEALADNDITQEEAKQLSENINLYGVYYSALIDNVTAGLELTENGMQYLQSSFKSVNANNDTSDSMMLRAISNNSDTILNDIKKSFELMEKTPDEVIIDETLTTSKLGKITAYYKKIQGFLNAVDSYQQELIKIKEMLKEALKKDPDLLEKVAELGIKMPGNERLLKIFLSKPILGINHLAVRLCNIIFAPINSSQLVNNVNYGVAAGLQLSIMGLNKQTRTTILKAQNEVSKAVVNSTWFKDFIPKTANLPNGTATFLTDEQRLIHLKEKQEYVKRMIRKNKAIMHILDKKESIQKNNLPKTQSDDLKYRKNKHPGPSKGFKDVRLAFIIAILETYNWLKIKEQTKDKQDDSFWSTEMVGASLTMMSATTELGYQFVKIIAGSGSIAAGRIKVMSGFFGAAAAVYVACQKFFKSIDEFSENNIVLGFLNLMNGLLYFGIAVTGFSTSLTYHIPWLTSRLIKNALVKTVSRQVIIRAITVYTAKFLSWRIVGLAFGFWIGIISLIIEGLIWYFSDNDLEEWLKLSAIGKDNNKTDAYDENKQEEEFNEMFESMFGFNPALPQNNQQNQANQSEQSIKEDEDFNEYDALVLITNDLARRDKVKLAEWQLKNQKPENHSNYGLPPNAIEDFFRGIN